jgi:phage terminase large subunit-like protein
MILVGVDPSGTGTGDEAGIIVVGRGTADRHAYVLADLSGQLSARQTGLLAWQAFYDHKADALVYEDNFGKQWLRDGLIDAYADHHNLDRDMRNALKDERTADTVSVPSPWKFLKKVTAQHGKKLRAQPVAMRYEQGRVHHVGVFLELEDQLTTWNPDEDGKAGNDSPDRIDALVHAATYLLKRERSVGIIATPHRAGLGSARGPVRPPMGMNRRFGT